jgi:hypothetical protein
MKPDNRVKMNPSVDRYVYLLLAAAMLAVAGQSNAADFYFKPSITVSEEYTDNVFLTTRSKQSDYITRTMPGFALIYKAPFWDWDVKYNYDFRYYAKGSRGNDHTHDISTHGLIKLVDEKLFLSVNDSYRRISLDAARTSTSESLFVNQTDVNTATVSPFVVLRPTSGVTLKTGYRYINTLYISSAGVDTINHVGFMEASYEVTQKLSLNLDYIFTRQETEGLQFNRHEAFIGPRYEYADKSFIFAQGGANRTYYSNGTLVTNPAWKGGLTHTFDTAVVTLTTDVKYTDTPQGSSLLTKSYSASLSRSISRGNITLNASYSDFTASDVFNPLSGSATVNQDRKSYTVGFNSKYELFSKLNGTLGLTYNYLTNEQLKTITRQYLVNSALEYTFADELSASLTYNYSDSSSAQIVGDNWKVNRVILEVKKVF